MSDPVANIEIEDVLSSIRRLFKEDSLRADEPPEKHEKQGDLTPKSADVPSDRLVLTPAFRVDPNREKKEPEAVDPEPESLTDGQENALDSVDKSAAHNGRRLHLTAQEPPKENLDVLVLGAWQGTKAETRLDAANVENIDHTHQASVQELVDPPENVKAPTTEDPISASLNRQSSLKATIAELEAAISDQGAEYEPDGSEEVGSIPENEPLQWQDSDDSVEYAASTAETVEPEPEVIELDAVAPQEVDPAFVRRHAAPAEMSEDEAAPVSQPDADALQEALDRDLIVDDLPLDEDALRDLVSEIVRQELQGALGERITRNVRKLVRREIHRIISSQEFE